MERIEKIVDIIVEADMDLAKAKDYDELNEKEKQFISSIVKGNNCPTPGAFGDRLAIGCICSARDHGDTTKNQIYEAASNLIEFMVNIDERVRSSALSCIREWYYND